MTDATIDDEEYQGVIKKFLYLNRRAPHGTIYALECLDVVLVGAAFSQDVSMVFMDDGVYQLKKGQDTSELGVKNFSKAFRALEMYDVEKVYVEASSLNARGLTEDDLLVPVKVLDSEALGQLMAEQDVVLSF